MLKKDLKILQKHDIIFRSTSMWLKKNDDGTLFKDNYGRFKKEFKKIEFKDGSIKTSIYIKGDNSCIVPTGQLYGNLIGIDIDNKDNTLALYGELCEKNKYDRNTLTIKTINNGFHEYYRLTKTQNDILYNLNSLTGLSIDNKDLHIDVKYNNQILFGPTFIKMSTDDIYSYSIYKDVEPIFLPDFLFNILVDNHNPPKRKIVFNKKKINMEVNVGNKINTLLDSANEILSDDNSTESSDELSSACDDYEYVDYNKDQRLRKYLDCLSIKTLTNYTTWFTIGCIIYNENGSLETYIYYSSKCENFDRNACIKTWNEISKKYKKKAKMNRLFELCKKDNYPLFLKTLQKDKDGILISIFNDGIGDLNASLLFYSIRPYSYVYDSQNSQLYRKNKYGIWKLDNECLYLHSDINYLIIDEIEKYYYEFLNNSPTKYSKGKNIKGKNEHEEKIKEYKYILNRSKNYLQKISNKKSIIGELKVLYKKYDIYELMDSVNPYIIGFDNGVYDFTSFQFRPALPEEYVSITTGYKYSEPDEEIKNNIYNTLNDILPDKEELTYVLKILSTALIGDMLLEQFYIWIGKGRNGRQRLVRLATL